MHYVGNCASITTCRSLVLGGLPIVPIGFHGGKVAVHRPRVRGYDGHEVALPTWTAAQAEDWHGRWAMNLMLISVSTRKLRRAVRLPEGDLPGMAPRSQRP